jgi:hypothetical protein
VVPECPASLIQLSHQFLVEPGATNGHHSIIATTCRRLPSCCWLLAAAVTRVSTASAYLTTATFAAAGGGGGGLALDYALHQALQLFRLPLHRWGGQVAAL